jgi:hypothetical protein
MDEQQNGQGYARHRRNTKNGMEFLSRPRRGQNRHPRIGYFGNHALRETGIYTEIRRGSKHAVRQASGFFP